MRIVNERIIEAEEGKYLTNGETYGTTVYLGKNDSPENWREVDELPPDEETQEEK